MTSSIANIDNTTLLSLTVNLDVGDIADPALRLAYFQYLNVYIQTITTAFNAFVANGAIANANLAAGIDALKLGTGLVDNAHLAFLADVTGLIQAQLDAKTPLTHVGSSGTSQHAIATALQAGFMSSTDFTKLASLIVSPSTTINIPADIPITFGGRFKIQYTSSTDTLDTYET